MVRTTASAQAFRLALHSLTKKQLNILARRKRKSSRACKLSLFRVPASSALLGRLTAILDRRLLPKLKRMSDPIPRSIIKNLKQNYSEQLPKTMRIRTAELNSTKSSAWKIADTLGIISALQSDELRTFGETITGKTLLPGPGCQIICYEPGDFSGPHTDHHPEDRDYKDGYVDIHIMLSSPYVTSQLLIHEGNDGMLNIAHEVGRGLGIAVYQLPFWHYTTPLLARSSTQPANRWLLLATYIIDRKSRLEPRQSNRRQEGGDAARRDRRRRF